jgi:hypothetical protein
VSDTQAAIERFGVKQADYLSMAPAVMLPTIGAALGGRLARGAGANTGRLIGGLVGGVGGLAIRENMSPRSAPAYDVPVSVPTYTVDPTTEDIPAWALEGARILKQAGILDRLFTKTAEGALDFVTEGIPGYIPAQEAVRGTRAHGLGHGLAQGGKAFLGLAAGSVPGALLGAGVGKGIERLTGRGKNIPLVNLSLSELLGGLGGSIGAVKGFRYATGVGH